MWCGLGFTLSGSVEQQTIGNNIPHDHKVGVSLHIGDDIGLCVSVRVESIKEVNGWIGRVRIRMFKFNRH